MYNLLLCFSLAYILEILNAFYTLGLAKGQITKAAVFSFIYGFVSVAITFIAVIQSKNIWLSALAVSLGYMLATITAMKIAAHKR